MLGAVSNCFEVGIEMIFLPAKDDTVGNGGVESCWDEKEAERKRELSGECPQSTLFLSTVSERDKILPVRASIGLNNRISGGCLLQFTLLVMFCKLSGFFVHLCRRLAIIDVGSSI